MGWFEHWKPSVAKSTWAVAALTFGLGFLPVFSRPGYESSLLFGLLVPPITAASAAVAMGAQGQVEQRLLAAVGRAGAHALALTALLSLHAMRVGWCAPGHDLGLLVLGPIAGLFTAACWGSFAGLGVGLLGLRRGVRMASLGIALLGPISGIVFGLVGFYRSPVVFAFDPFVGFFAGSPYDTGFDPTPRLLSYRAGTLGLWLLLWALARHLDRDESGRVSLGRLLQRDPRGRWMPSPLIDRPVVAVGLFGLGLFAAVTSLGESLGHRSSTAWIRRSLGQSVTVGRCEVVFGPAQKQLSVQRLAADCDAWLTRLERRLGTRTLERVTAFVFDGPAQKELLMGAAHTQIAKPWRREIYLNGANYPDDVVGHELAHVVGGLTARGPFEIAGSFGGWLPNPGLIEGLAVALAPDEDGDRTALEWSAALRSVGKLPELGRVFSLEFLGHSGPLAYTVAGAFVEWLGQHYGKRAVRRWYAGDSIEQAAGLPFAELERRFLARLDQLHLPEGAREAALAKFARPGIYSRRCPHAVDRALAEGEQRLAAGDPSKACAWFAEAHRLDASEIRARIGLGECAERGAALPEQAQRAYSAIAEDASQPMPVRQRAREKLADLLLGSGDAQQARPIYEQLVRETFEIDRRRSLDVKIAAATPTAIRAVRTLLLGIDGEPAWDVAVRDLLRWSNEAPEQGLADYLLGRNYWQKGREAAAVEHLERALVRGISLPEIHAEALRQRAMLACALGDKPRAVALAERLSKEPALPTARRQGILRVVERCAGRLVGDDWPELPANASDPPEETLALPATAAPASTLVPPLAYDSDAFDCGESMQKIPGGEFWVGSKRGSRSPDEAPRFLTKVRGFCLDPTEVSVAAYARCVQAGHCRAALGKTQSCNARHADRGNHPINCVDHPQAVSFCATLDARLPTEIEWEYAARGGKAALRYPWGEGSPDGRACWKSSSSCPVASYAAGAFGLYDMTGNVWEWTSSDYGDYPWATPLAGDAALKIYRGGGWSRRFEKWMHVGLRNRSLPQGEGAHLGFRCAKSVARLDCPFAADPHGSCLFGVLDAECRIGEAWNGQRCAKPGEPTCPLGTHAESGWGCLRDVPMLIKSVPPNVLTVRRQRSPEFDADCRHNQPKRPKAYRYSGSSHEARNLASSRAGCKNRDVGVGWNSTCCP